MTHVRLLLAEDEPDHRTLLVSTLRASHPGVDIRTADNGEDFLNAIREERFDCLVMDYNLGPMDAPDVLLRARDHIRGTPIVVVSASEEQRVVIESLRFGVADFVPKSRALEDQVLWKRIHAAITLARRQRAERRRSIRRMQNLRWAADHDTLTGLRNRRYINHILSSGRIRSDRRNALACVMLDLDHFKSVNDSFGHHAGDLVLTSVARLLEDRASRTDVVVRWGGEEFLVLMSSATLADAWIWAENFRRELELKQIEAEDATINITASLGCAVVPASAFGEASVNAADRALYLAKDLGRNRVCTAQMAALCDAAQSIQAATPPDFPTRTQTLLNNAGSLGECQRQQTGPHCRAVKDIAVAIGSSLALDAPSLRELELASLFHDVGKLVVPEQLLAKPASLTPDERLLVDQHPACGSILCAALGMPPGISRAVAQHHVRYDASFSHREPPEERSAALARIIAVADAFTAMTEDRPYAPRRSPTQALSELQRQRGKQFDPVAVDACNALVRNSLSRAA